MTDFIRDPYRRLTGHFLVRDEDDVSDSELAHCTEVVDRIVRTAGAGSFEERFAEARGFPISDEVERKEVYGLLLCLHLGWWTKDVQIGGYYDHYKGGYYFVEKLILDTATKQDKFVYQSVYTKKWFGRAPHEWREIVEWPDGVLRSRFIQRGFFEADLEPPFKVAFVP